MVKRLNEDAPPAFTLGPKSMGYDDFQSDVDKALEHFQSLNAKQKERYVGMAQSMMADAGAGKGTSSSELLRPYQEGAGVPSGTAERNKRFSKEEVDWPTVSDWLADELDQELDNIGFNEETREKCAILFEQAVQDRVGSGPFAQAVREFVNEWGFNPFLTEDEIDVMELLASKIQQLEDQIDYIEQESAALAEECIALSENLQEETDYYNTTRSQRLPRRSSVNETMLEANEDNADALYNQEQQVRNKTMDRYLRYFGSE